MDFQIVKGSWILLNVIRHEDNKTDLYEKITLKTAANNPKSKIHLWYIVTKTQEHNI